MALQRKGPGLSGVLKNVRALTRTDVLVGIPAENAERDGEGPNNAALGYIHETGSPESNAPARPFLVPGVEAVQDEIVAAFKAAGQAALEGDLAKVEQQQRKAGFAAEMSAKKMILGGLSPALSERTLRQRADRRTESGKASQSEASKGARKELASRAKGNAPSSVDARPLYDTHGIFTAITHVIRPRGE